MKYMTIIAGFVDTTLCYGLRYNYSVITFVVELLTKSFSNFAIKFLFIIIRSNYLYINKLI